MTFPREHKNLRTGSFVPLQKHAFFKHVNWDDLLHKRVEPPYKPQLVGQRLSIPFIYSKPEELIQQSLLPFFFKLTSLPIYLLLRVSL